MWIDSHCHLSHANMEEGLSPKDLVAAANDAGVGGMLSVCCSISEEFPSILNTAKEFDNVWCSVGTHPHDAGVKAEIAISEEDIIKMALSDPKIIAIGESGLDYFYDNSPREAQQESFRKHIRACIEADLPLIVHTRDADEDCIRIMRQEGAGANLKGVMHCFSSSAELAAQAIEFGFYISLSGIVTFNKADGLREIAKNVPLDRLLVETDAPFLAPMPLRGKLNQPAYVTHTGEFLANLLDVEPETLAKTTTENFFRLFDTAQLNA